MSVFSAMGYYDNKRKLSFTKGHVLNSDESKGIFPSEARFLQRATEEKQFFNNSIKHLVEQVTKLNASLIGIQEFYPPTLTEITKPLEGVNSNFVSCVFNKVISNNASVLTIWDTEKYGGLNTEYHEDLGLTEGVDKIGNGDTGRPISIITTKKGYIFMNFHGFNRPRLTTIPIDVAPLLQAAITIHAKNAGILTMDLKKLIIMCDSNDRGHLINKDKGIVLNDINFHDGHAPAEGAKSCCYNYDSCDLPFPTDEGPIPKSMGDKGSESKYIYTGDYVLGAAVIEGVITVDSPQDAEGASKASDHMLVYAKLNVPISSGGRRNKSNTRVSRKTRTKGTKKLARKARK